MALSREVFRSISFDRGSSYSDIVNYMTNAQASSFFPIYWRNTRRRIPKSRHRRSGALQIISRDLEFVAVGTGSINGMSNFVVLKSELNAGPVQFILPGQKIH